jgi:hypothetical protein
MDMVSGHFTGNNFDLMLQRNLSQQIPCTDCNLASQYPFSIFGNPKQVHLEVCFCMGFKFVKSYSDNYNLFFA